MVVIQFMSSYKKHFLFGFCARAFFFFFFKEYGIVLHLQANKKCSDERVQKIHSSAHRVASIALLNLCNLCIFS